MLLSNGIATCELKTNTNAEPIPWESLSAKAIRDRQKWLTSNCCVDAINDKQTPSSIQKQMQSIIREEIGDDSNSDVVNLMPIPSCRNVIRSVFAFTHREEYSHR